MFYQSTPCLLLPKIRNNQQWLYTFFCGWSSPFDRCVKNSLRLKIEWQFKKKSLISTVVCKAMHVSFFLSIRLIWFFWENEGLTIILILTIPFWTISWSSFPMFIYLTWRDFGAVKPLFFACLQPFLWFLPSCHFAQCAKKVFMIDTDLIEN